MKIDGETVKMCSRGSLPIRLLRARDKLLTYGYQKLERRVEKEGPVTVGQWDFQGSTSTYTN